ncbi:MAG: hypothetical protein ACK5OB_04400 [Pirellula sp.]
MLTTSIPTARAIPRGDICSGDNWSRDIVVPNRKDIIMFEVGLNREQAVLRKTNSHHRGQVHAADRIDRTGTLARTVDREGCL